MRNIKAKCRSFLCDESGVTAIEYGILAAAMAAAIGRYFWWRWHLCESTE
ncbi:Flp family type IVb pilin [Candidatus Symbiopectobacterium sp. PLON1]|nr:Flp family type IVb pilin [Candidatus Symbiopectobacterium sp. PLON1]